MKKILSVLFVSALLLPSLVGAYFDVSLKYGSKGDSVAELQDFLQDQGYLTGKIDGKFGLGTRKAVISWQSANNLGSDGYFGVLSRQKASEQLEATLKPSLDAEQKETGTVSTTFPDGCTSLQGFSMTTGKKCDGTFTPNQVTDVSAQAKLDALAAQLKAQQDALNQIAQNTTPTGQVPVVVDPITPTQPVLTPVSFGSYDTNIDNGNALPLLNVSSKDNSYTSPLANGETLSVNEIIISFDLTGIIKPGDKIKIIFNGSTKDFTLKAKETPFSYGDNYIVGSTPNHPIGNNWSYTIGHTGHLDFNYDADYPYTFSLQRDGRIATQVGVLRTVNKPN